MEIRSVPANLPGKASHDLPNMISNDGLGEE